MGLSSRFSLAHCLLLLLVAIVVASCATMAPDLNSAQDYNDRGIGYAKKGQYDLAIADFNKALELDPTFAWPYNNRALAYMEGKGDLDRAIADYTRALQIDPRYTEAYLGRGFAYRNQGDFDKAIADYTKALEIDPRSAGAYYNRAAAHYFKKEYDQAWDDLHEAERLGYTIHPKFLRLLREASGRDG